MQNWPKPLMKNLPRKKEEEPHSKTEALSVDIVLYTNATPCKGCAKNLVQFKKKLEDNHSKVTLKIKFSSLYNIQRNSCRKCNYVAAKNNDHKDNTEGIKEMSHSKFKLSPFGSADWKILEGKLKIQSKHLKTWKDGINNRKQEDINLKADLKFILQ